MIKTRKSIVRPSRGAQWKTGIFRLIKIPKRFTAYSHMRKELSPKIDPRYPTINQIPLNLRDWSKELRDYTPVTFTAQSVLNNAKSKTPNGWADDPSPTSAEILSRIESGEMFSYEGKIALNPKSGLPLNPAGRKGICERGLWGKWGPNHAADPILVRLNTMTHKVEVLLVQRGTGEWALPGGMVNKGENPEQTMWRELQEETGVSLDGFAARKVFAGAVRCDPRDTDNAWVETTAFLVYLGTKGEHINPVAGDDAKVAQWRELNESNLKNLFANHASLIRAAVDRLLLEDLNSLPDSALKQLKQIHHEPLRTNLTGLKGKIGVFGGTFDPLHKSHLALAKAAERQLGLDAVIFIPTAKNPLKEHGPIGTNSERTHMLREAIVSERKWYVYPVQHRRSDLCLTADLIDALVAESGDEAKFYTLVGGDCVRQFPQWTKLQELRENSVITPVNRRGFNLKEAVKDLEPRFAGELLANAVHTAIPGHAATKIRTLLRHPTTREATLRKLDLVAPTSIKTFIEEFGLYK